MEETRYDRCRRLRRRGLHLGGAPPIYPSDAERLLYGPSQIIANRLVIFLAFERTLYPAGLREEAFLRRELISELRRIADTRLRPHNRPMKARTLYRLLCIRHARGWTGHDTPARIAIWSNHHRRNERSGTEVDRLIRQFLRQASVLMSRGVVPVALLDALLGPLGDDRASGA